MGKGYLWFPQRLIMRLVALNTFIKDFKKNRYELMKLIVEMMLRGIISIVGGENIIQEQLNDLEDWTYRIKPNLTYLCAWSHSFTLITRFPALLGGKPLEMNEEEKYLNVLADPKIV